ncbi:bile acid:sodium symporter family protein [Micrococcus luteus]|uniref:bile acid:sodium symporter family protein n=1 Tax=Micrococcus luteus TaxID=1270 RepID=UPI002A58E180|nr:bile acid:sodium symporter family protein [Micrococcus luteus]
MPNPPIPGRPRASAAVIAFPLVIIVCAVLSALMPELAAPIGPYVPILLGFIMFTMGMTLTLPDLKVLRTAPHAVFVGLILQYTVMPLSGWALGVLFGLDPMLIVGMVLLGSVPGGTASNIVTYLARGNVALSVAMTSLSTLVSPLLSPLLIMWLAGSYLPVDAGALVQQILQIVLIPVVLGILVQLLARNFVARVAGIVPWLSIAGVALVLSGVMAKSSAVVLGAGVAVYVAVILHNLVGFGLGWLGARAARLGPRERRAISLEVGMQNSALAATLGGAHFGPLAALPGAVAAAWHNIGGPILALLFTRGDTEPAVPVDDAPVQAAASADPVPR